MAAELAVIDILKSNQDVRELINDSEGNAKIYPFEIPQGAEYPCIVVSVEDVEPMNVKDGASELDIELVKVEAIDTKFKDTRNNTGAYQLGTLVRAALDRTTGTYQSVVVQQCIYDSRSAFKEEINNKVLFIEEHFYRLRIVR